MSAYINFDGINTLDKDLRLLNTVVHSSAEKRIEFIEIDGRDGELVIDRESLKNVTKSHQFKMWTNTDVAQRAHDIAQWLVNSRGWCDTYLSWDTDYVYKALYRETFSVEEVLRNYGSVQINLIYKPIKHRTDGLRPLRVSNGQTLINPEKRSSKPLIRVTGTGNTTIKNNGVDWLILTGAPSDIYIDSETMEVWNGQGDQFDRMNGNLTPLFPLLKPGENNLSWNSGATVDITPRWEAVVT